MKTTTFCYILVCSDIVCVGYKSTHQRRASCCGYCIVLPHEPTRSTVRCCVMVNGLLSVMNNVNMLNITDSCHYCKMCLQLHTYERKSLAKRNSSHGVSCDTSVSLCFQMSCPSPILIIGYICTVIISCVFIHDKSFITNLPTAACGHPCRLHVKVKRLK